MYGPPLGRLLFDLALHQAGVFGQDADADFRGQQVEVEGAALAAHVEIALEEDEAGPDEGAVRRDLFGSEQQLGEALRRPLGEARAGRAAGGHLPQRDANGANEGDGQDEPGPFAVWTLGLRVRHAGIQRNPARERGVK